MSMKYFGVIVFLAGTLAVPGSAQTLHAQTVSGTLVDADCKADAPRDECRLTPTSKAFGIETAGGHYLRFDSHGNAAVHVALDKRRRKIGDIDRARSIKASVSGSKDGETFKVDAVESY